MSNSTELEQLLAAASAAIERLTARVEQMEKREAKTRALLREIADQNKLTRTR